jgi:hypothetical protein
LHKNILQRNITCRKTCLIICQYGPMLYFETCLKNMHAKKYVLSMTRITFHVLKHDKNDLHALKHVGKGLYALKHGRKMLKRIYMLWNVSTMACLFCSNIPKTCEEGHAHFKTWLKYVGKYLNVLKHAKFGLHVLKHV